MRTGLTVIAILLILALTAALVGPYYIDWDKQRAEVEAQLSHVLAERVTVKGAIDLKLLPSPYVTLNQVEISDQKTGDVLFACDEMELALGLTSLARGQFRFTQASFDHPTIMLAHRSDGSVALPRLVLAKHSDSIAFDKVVVRDGRVRMKGADGVAGLDVAGIDLEAEAISLLGPFKGAGKAPGPGGVKLAFNFSTGVVEGAELRFKATVDAGTALPHSEFDGALALAAETSNSGIAAAGYSGAAVFSGEAAAADGRIPWRASGLLKADLRRASLDNLDVRLGREDRALAANGSAQIEFGATPHASVALAAKQLNIDALLRQPGEDSAPPARAFRALGAALAGSDIASGSPIPVAFKLETPAALLGGDTIADLALSIEANPGASIGLKLEASPPGGSHIAAAGALDLGLAPDFKGKIDAKIGDAPRLREWLAPDAPDLAARLAAIGDVLPYRSVSASGDIDLSGAGFVARNLSLALERSTFTGTLALTRAVGAERGRMFMDLQTDSLDIDALPNLAASEDVLGGIDLSLALDAHAIHVARIGETEVEGGSLALKLTRQNGDVRLDRLSIANLGGASVDANGASDVAGRWVNVKLDATKLRDFALLVRRVAPGTLSDVLLDRAEALSPAKVTFNAHSPISNGNAADPADSVTMLGTVGTTHVEAKLDRAAGALGAAITLDAPDATTLLRQIGLAPAPVAGLGRGHLVASANGRWADGLDADISASLAGAELTWRGRFSPNASDIDSALFGGAGAVRTNNAMPLLVLLGIAPPDSTAAVPVDLSAAMTWRNDRLSFSQLQAVVGHAHFSGDLSYRPAPVQAISAIPIDPDVALAEAVAGAPATTNAPQLEGSLWADRLSLSALTGLALGPPQPAKGGVAWSDVKFSPGLSNPPPADIAVKVATLDIGDNLIAHEAGGHLKLARGMMGLDDFSMNVAGSAVSGRATIRRDGASASLSGRISVDPIAFDRPNFAGQASGSIDFASTGQSVDALIAGLAGTGRVRLDGMRIPRLDQGALGRIVEKAQSSDYAIDQVNVSRALELELNKQPLRLADADASATLTAGTIHLGPFVTRISGDDASVQANFDLRSLILEIRAAFTQTRAPKYWSGTLPAINVVLKGPIESSARQIDSGLFVAGLAAQAIARETERIAALESDIRERAFFNRRLKAGQFMRRRELELEAYAADQARLKSEADRKRVEAETLKVYEEKRKAAASEQPTDPPPSPPAPSSNNPAQTSTNAAPPILQPPVPLPRPPSASQRSDPTATGLY